MLTILGILIPLIGDMLRWWRLAFCSTRSIKAENLFLRRQLAQYVERGVKPQRIDPVMRISLAILKIVNRRSTLTMQRRPNLTSFLRTESGALGFPPVTRIVSSAGGRFYRRSDRASCSR